MSFGLNIMNIGLENLPPRADDNLVNVIVDTPKGSRNKYKYDEKTHCFRLSRILPAGASFPYDFGYIPQTLAEDGDPLDVMLISEVPSFAGCSFTVKLIGTISGIQTEKGKSMRNDRLLGVPVTSVNPIPFEHIDDLPPGWITEVEHFFVSYNSVQGREFETIAHGGPKEADEALARAEQRYKLQKEDKSKQ
jgi:inorganic pyrophosphatase